MGEEERQGKGKCKGSRFTGIDNDKGNGDCKCRGESKSRRKGKVEDGEGNHSDKGKGNKGNRKDEEKDNHRSTNLHTHKFLQTFLGRTPPEQRMQRRKQTMIRSKGQNLAI